MSEELGGSNLDEAGGIIVEEEIGSSSKDALIINGDDGKVGTLGERSELREEIKKLAVWIEEMFVEMGGKLYTVSKEKLYISWGFRSFEDYLETDLDTGVRRGKYLLAIYRYFNEEIKRPDLLEEVKHIGWTKLKELVHVINGDNKDLILKLAESCNSAQFADAIGKLKKEMASKRDEISGEIKMGKGDYKDAIGRISGEVADKHHMTFAFDDEQYANVMDALDIAGKLMGAMDKGEKLSNKMSMVCLEFLTNNSDFSKKSVDGNGALIGYLGRIEQAIGIKLVCLKEGNIIHGKDLVV
ncbi:MAG: hypothetical protein HQK96_05575 [Nitrospirae bacterium]|nr:hypothetical protein [Nitrospirota bacterium]